MVTITRSQARDGWTMKFSELGTSFKPFSAEAISLEEVFAAIRHYYADDRHAHWLCPLCRQEREEE